MGRNLLKLHHQLVAVHLRHGEIGQHQVNEVLGKDADGFLTVDG